MKTEEENRSVIENAWNERAKKAGMVRTRNPSRPWYRYANELLSKLPPSKKDGTDALDVGCGVGEFMGMLRDLGFKVEGIDGSQEQMDTVASMGFEGRVADLEDGLPFPNESFGLVTCLELIEHIAGAEDLLKEVYRVLHPGGYLLLSTPNFSFLNNRLHYLFGAPPCNEGVHLRYFTKQGLESLLNRTDFRTVQRNSYGVIPLLSTLTMRLFKGEPVLWRTPAALESFLAYDFIYLVERV
jgi:2-polyprenyl-3-methyl-5-hydroxy-6-metoxy-1,4-benzoquinol methylase